MSDNMKTEQITGIVAFLLISALMVGFVSADGADGYDIEIETVESNCLSDGNETGIVEVETTDNGLVISGFMQTPNPCYVVNVSGIERDGDRYILDLVPEPEEGVCIQCVGNVKYELLFASDESGVVEVLHDEERVGEFEFNGTESTGSGSADMTVFEIISNWFSSVFGF